MHFGMEESRAASRGKLKSEEFLQILSALPTNPLHFSNFPSSSSPSHPSYSSPSSSFSVSSSSTSSLLSSSSSSASASDSDSASASGSSYSYASSSSSSVSPSYSSSASSSFSLAAEEALENLARIARTAEGRRELADLQTVPFLLSLFPSFLPHPPFSPQAHLSIAQNPSPAESDALRILAILLRALRNLCAGEASSQDAFRVCKGVETLASLSRDFLFFNYESVDDKIHPDSASLVVLAKLLLQLLGNVAGRGEANKSAIWENFFPHLFSNFAAWKDAQEPLCMVLFTCCHSQDRRLEQFSEPTGAALLGKLILDNGGINACQIQRSSLDPGPLSDTPSPEATTNGWLRLLIWELCMEKPYLPAIFASLRPAESCNFSSYARIYDRRSGDKSRPEQQNFVAAQANLLCILCTVLYEDIEDEINSGITISERTVAFLVEVIRRSAHCAFPLCGEACELPTGSPIIDVLGYSLLLARKLCAIESPLNFSSGENIKEELDSSEACFAHGDFSSPQKFKASDRIGSLLEKPTNTEPMSNAKSSPYQIRKSLAQQGLVPLLLRMLKALGPPATVAKVINSRGAGEFHAESRFLPHGDLDSGKISNSTSVLKIDQAVHVEASRAAVGAEANSIGNDEGKLPKKEPSTYISDKVGRVGNRARSKDNENLGLCLRNAGDLFKARDLDKGDGPLPSKNLYKGFRRDIVAVLANIAFKHFDAQEQIRENEGLLLLLQQSIADNDNPFLREWGLWAMRNLLYDNEKNQQEVLCLQLKGLANSSEVLQTGLSVEVDPATQRPKLVNISVKS